MAHPSQRLSRQEIIVLIAMGLGLLIAYRVSAQLPFTALGLAIFTPLALWRPDLALAYVPFTVALYFMPKGLFDARFGIRESGIYVPLHEVVLLITLAGAGLRLLIFGVFWRLHRQKTPKKIFGGGVAAPLLPIILFLAAGVWGFVIAEARGAALRELRWVIVEPLIFFGLLRFYSDQRGPRYLHLLIIFWLSGGALVGLVGILQLAGLNLAPLIGIKSGYSEDLIAVEGVRRATGLYGHPNNLGLALGRLWPVAAALAHAAFWHGPGGAARLRRAWPLLLLTLLSLGGLLASFSRGAYLGALVAGVILAITLIPAHLRPPRRVLLGLGLVGMLGLLVLAFSVERFNLIGGSSSIRLQTWASALAMLRDHPLGIGLDQFGLIYPYYIAPELASTNEIHTAHPHNLILDIALRMGPLGIIAVGWLLLRFYRQPIPPTSALMIGASAAMSAALVHGLVDSFYFWPDLAFAFWMLLAIRLGRGQNP
ncbi:O-antigen ligase family protein [Candidatus Oscillochloris fontis]|uniref:O-antigen ligase family protein n=1 Tax=Candidatus Oscillochloris fontis TaxID=2496868 RepID=UPI00137597B1|nr:O-antigen ligase family protein [Candidatus Oscillochloris fontis]